jgi:hypothetical protein
MANVLFLANNVISDGGVGWGSMSHVVLHAGVSAVLWFFELLCVFIPLSKELCSAGAKVPGGKEGEGP